MNTIFEFSQLSSALRSLVQSRKSIDPKFSYGLLADICSIQRSYLSQVLSGKSRLNSDQLFLISNVLNLDLEESEYLNLLNDIEGTSIKNRKIALEAKLKNIQSTKINSDTVLKRKTIENFGEISAKYYTNPNYPLSHMFLLIPEYAKKPTLIAEQLGIDGATFAEILKTLEILKIISIKSNGKVEVQLKTLHLPATSYLSKINAVAFRLKSIEYIQKMKSDKNYHFTATFSGTEETQQKVKTYFLEFLEKTSKEIENAANEKIFQINFDLFQI